MAIIACPSCGKKISSKAPSCQFCQRPLGELSPAEADKIARDKRTQKNRSINNQAMLSVVIFLAGFMVFYFKEPENGSWQQTLNYLVMGVAAASYIMAKIRMVIFKRS